MFKVDSRANFFGHGDGTYIQFINLPDISHFEKGQCLQVSRADQWTTHKCNVTSANTGVICQQENTNSCK